MKKDAPRLFSHILAAFAGGFALLSAVSLVSLRTFGAAKEARDSARRAADVREAVEETVSLLKDVESGSRGYVLTGEKTFLASYSAGQAALDATLARLHAVLDDGGAPSLQGAELDALARRRAAVSREVATRAGGMPAGERVRLLEAGKAVMDEVRARARDLTAREAAIESAQRERAARLERDARAAIYGSLLIALALFAGAAAVIRREIAARERLAEAVRASQEQLQSILDHTPAVVAIKDGDGRFVFANRRYERILRRGAGSPVGKTVFDLWPREVAQVLHANDEEVIRTGKILECEETVPQKDGPHAYLSLKFPLPGAGERLVCGISIDITERKRLESLKSEVVALASHELRTPLTVIQGALKYLAAGDPPSVAPEARELVDMGLRNARHMLSVINSYLDLAAIESGETPLEIAELDLNAIASESAESMRHCDPERGLRYALRTGGEPALVRGDPERLTEVVGNLLSNAAKFSPDGAEVSLAVETRGDRVRFSVRDRGPGIRKEFEKRVFGRFARDAAGAGGVKGTGLGLSLSKALIERMGGSIGFETKEGEGTTFFFDLPSAASAAGAAAGAAGAGAETPRPRRSHR